MIIVQSPPPKRRTFLATKLPWLVFTVVALAATAFGLNWALIQAPVASLLAQDPRNSKVTTYAYARWGIDPSTLVVDLRSISGEASMTDVARVLMQTASALRSMQFSRVHLAYRGQARFMIEGVYFQQLGRDYGTENPLYTIRTMPENVYNLDGARVFDTWSGGLLGVMGKQMEDVGSFHRRWYMDSIIAEGRLRP
ncbi:MAG: hypothetical protein JNK84_14130 [Phreatobacter sp.]|uniref:hypothetical protein n=1 Tax=Phreatobacter sp. TaxID=1966341 RepID=UPI001A3F2ABB|nr:hypothetical protein [Phreatobacter sp.]MBL8570204.1 hypothetical protein [Phreatobacter sp.]